MAWEIGCCKHLGEGVRVRITAGGEALARQSLALWLGSVEGWLPAHPGHCSTAFVSSPRALAPMDTWAKTSSGSTPPRPGAKPTLI